MNIVKENSEKLEELLNKVFENKKITFIKKIKSIWLTLENNDIKFLEKTSNISLTDSFLFNNGFNEFLKFYGFQNNSNEPTAFITSKNRNGLYSVNFTNVDNNQYINKMSLSKWCEGSHITQQPI